MMILGLQLLSLRMFFAHTYLQTFVHSYGTHSIIHFRKSIILQSTPLTQSDDIKIEELKEEPH